MTSELDSDLGGAGQTFVNLPYGVPLIMIRNCLEFILETHINVLLIRPLQNLHLASISKNLNLCRSDPIAVLHMTGEVMRQEYS